MAVQTLLLELKWENDNYFQMKAQLDGGTAYTISRHDEDGHVNELWGNIQAVCEAYFKTKISEIGKEMLA